VFGRAFAVIDGSGKENDEQDHVDRRHKEERVRIDAGRAVSADHQRIPRSGHPDDHDESRQCDAGKSHRHVQLQVFAADERDLCDEVDHPRRHYHPVRMHKRIRQRLCTEKRAEIIRSRISDHDQQRKYDRSYQKQ